MYPFIYIQIHMLEVRVKQLEKQAAEKEAAKEVAEKEAVEKEAARKEAAKMEASEKEAAEKEVVEKEVVEKEAVETEDNEEEEDPSWQPSESSDDDSPICFRCPICFSHLYQHKNSLFFHIKYMITDEFSPPNVVERQRQLNMLIEAAICDA
jgi:flagellar biosynthesis GTPase FlhF